MKILSTGFTHETKDARAVNLNEHGDIVSITSMSIEDDVLKCAWFSMESIKPFLMGNYKFSDYKVVKTDDIFVYEIIKSKVDIKQRNKDSQLYKLNNEKYCEISVTWDGTELCFTPSKELVKNANVDEHQNVTLAGKTHHPFFITYENRPDFIIQTISIPFAKLLSSETRVKFEYNKYNISLYTQKYLETYSFRRT